MQTHESIFVYRMTIFFIVTPLQQEVLSQITETGLHCFDLVQPPSNKKGILHEKG